MKQIANKMRRKRRKITQGIHPATIASMSHDCRGVTTLGGKTVFVAGALPGEAITFKYLKQQSQFSEAYAVDVLEASEDRITPRCPHFGVCGGCRLQHLSQEDQLKYKAASLADQLTHFGQVNPLRWLAPMMDEAFGYRKKARLGVKYVPKKGGVLVGFRELDGRFIADMNTCDVLHPSIGQKIIALKALMNTLEAKAQIPQIEVAIDDQRTSLIVRHLAPLSSDDQAKITAFAAHHALWIYLQPKGPDTIHLLWPKQLTEPHLSYTIHPFDITISFLPQHFTQVNQGINQKMINKALELLELSPEDRVLDLFCGMGNFTLPMATQAAQVTGVEGSAEMVDLARKNATQNNLDNVSFYEADLFKDNARAAFMQQTYDKILLDPARTGAKEMVAKIDAFKAKRIVYISCNPSTLARDAGILVNQKKYTLEACGVIDMFPQTAHVEAIALFVKPS